MNAWGLVHRGMEVSWARFNRESNLQAEALYRQALELDADNPKAQAALAMSVAMKVSNGWSPDINAERSESIALGRQALATAPNDPMILCCVGHQNTCLGQADEGVRLLRRAAELDQSSAIARGLQALALIGTGQAEQAVEQLNEALRLSPHDTARHWYHGIYAFAYVQLGQFEDAAREARESIGSFRGWQPPWATLAVALAALGQDDEAQEAALTASELEPLVGRDGYERFFEFITRHGDNARRTRELLKKCWPPEH